ncbi:hypothetical protein SLA2020_029920 [Shorea laevis]
MWVRTYLTKNSLPWDHYSYGRRSLGLGLLAPLSVDLLALGRRQRRYMVSRSAKTYVFGKQLLGLGHCDPLCEEAPLLLKLQGYFVEFLRETS